MITLTGGFGVIEYERPVFTSLYFRCYWRNSEDAFTRVNVSLAPYDDIFFYFTKPCILPELNVGTELNLPNIISNTTVLNNVSLSSPADETQSEYYMWLAPYSVLKDLNFNFLPVTSDKSIVAVGIRATNPSKFLNTSVSNGFYLSWTCLTITQAVTSVRVSIDINFERNLEFNVTKTCPERNGPSSPPGWSTAGIFFFVVFLIIVVFCVAGCGYNFVKNEKTGCDVVPGASYYRSCYEKVFPPKRYTPQMDNYDTTTSASSSGKSYGSTAYSDNL